MSLNDVPGEPIWIELLTPDPDSAKAFYGGLFGWTARDTGEEYGGYVIFERDGREIAGCMKSDGNAPSAWIVYLESNSVADTVAMARANGGQVLMDPLQVGDFGHLAVVTDPAGATVGIWQPIEMAGISTRGETGAPTWFELMSSDYAAVIAFYENAFGWNTRTLSDTDDFRYTTLGQDEHALAGIMDASGFLGDQPSHWQFYLGVDDTDTAIATASGLDGSLVDGPDDSPYGRIATIADPSGVTFRVMGPNAETA